jgi:hypothetical protein
MFSSFSLSFLSFYSTVYFFISAECRFQRSIVFVALSVDVASLPRLVVCELPWRFGFLVSRSAALYFSGVVSGEREYSS